MTDQRLPDPTRAFWAGWWACTPFVFAAVPFGVLFGVVAREAGLDLLQTMAMSVVVIAGAAQFTALALLVDQAPVFLALAAGLAVNLRMAMYSAALQPHLGHATMGQRMAMAYLMVDQAYAVATARYDQPPGESTPTMAPSEKVAYYFGVVLLICPLWIAATLTGALVGNMIPPALSLEFAAPICFIALFSPMLRTLPHMVTAGVAVIGAIVFSGLPTGVGLICAAFVAMLAGAETERRLQARA